MMEEDDVELIDFQKEVEEQTQASSTRSGRRTTFWLLTGIVVALLGALTISVIITLAIPRKTSTPFVPVGPAKHTETNDTSIPTSTASLPISSSTETTTTTTTTSPSPTSPSSATNSTTPDSTTAPPATTAAPPTAPTTAASEATTEPVTFPQSSTEPTTTSETPHPPQKSKLSLAAAQNDTEELIAHFA